MSDSDTQGTSAEDFDAPDRGSADELLDAGAHSELDAMRHSAAHVMAEAVMDLFPGTKLGIGPAIDDGFYYDFDLPRPLTPEDLAAIEARMAASVAADHPFVRHELARPRVGRSSSSAASRTRSRSSTTSPRGPKAAGEPMPPCRPTSTARSWTCARARTSPAPAGSARSSCSAVAGAYWRGDEKRPMLQRIYGTVWATQEELDRYLWRRAEAKKRDHRKLGRTARPVQLPPSRPGARSGIRRGGALACAGDLVARSAPGRADSTRSARRRWSARSCGRPPATGPSTRTTCSFSRTETTPRASSR